MSKVFIGISSWADPGLVESKFYPETVTTPAERLRFYSRSFPVAEIDSSYHHFPMNRELEYWLDNVPERFMFDIKAFSLFTHHPTPFLSLPRTIREEYGGLINADGNIYWHHLPDKAAEELWAGFSRAANVIKAAGKLGSVTFQFPPWFHPGDEGYSYLSHITEMMSQIQLAVEFRFDAWLNENNREKTLRFLKEKGIALVCVDEPQGFRSSLPPLARVTSRLGIIRFHGRNAAAWEDKNAMPDEKFRYLYKKKELEEWLPKVRKMAENAEEIHVIFKNKHTDFPVQNARQFSELMGSKTGLILL